MDIGYLPPDPVYLAVNVLFKYLKKEVGKIENILRGYRKNEKSIDGIQIPVDGCRELLTDIMKILMKILMKLQWDDSPTMDRICNARDQVRDFEVRLDTLQRDIEAIKGLRQRVRAVQ